MSRSTGWSTAEVDFDKMALWEQRSLKGHWLTPIRVRSTESSLPY